MKITTTDALTKLNYPIYRKIGNDFAFMCFINPETYIYACPNSDAACIDVCQVTDFAYEKYILHGVEITQDEFSTALDKTTMSLNRLLPVGIGLSVIDFAPESWHQPEHKPVVYLVTPLTSIV